MTQEGIPLYAGVRHVEIVNPNLVQRPRSSEVNDYIHMDGWILLDTGKNAYEGDNGPYSIVYFVVGWIGEGEPQFPPGG